MINKIQNEYHPYSTNPKRNAIGRLLNTNTQKKQTPFDQQVLTKKELALLDKMFNKMAKAVLRFHKAGKCHIENHANWPCEARIRLETGKVYHYPNGYYI